MSGFRIRLLVRIAKALTSDATTLKVTVMNKEVTVSSQKKAEPLNEATWIVLDVRGFAREDAAREFGSRLRSILQLGGLASRLGVDAGSDKTIAWVSEEFARKKLGLKDNERMHQMCTVCRYSRTTDGRPVFQSLTHMGR